MGPRPFSRGYMPPQSLIPMISLASMGPRPFSRGYYISHPHLHKQDIASMGPRPFSRGYGSQYIALEFWWLLLQWGHGLSAVDTLVNDSAQAFIARGLQWGHGLSAVDTNCKDGLIGVCCIGFNGATAFQPWILDKERRRRGRRPCFNGATAFQPWIQLRGERRLIFSFLLQWGHGLSAVDTISY